MTTHYSIVQYVPDAIRDERVNIGVVAFSENQIESQFLTNWQRVKQFGGNERFLKDVARNLSRIEAGQFASLVNNWTQSVQFTKPAASLLSVEELLIDATRRYLVDPQVTQRAYRTHSEVVNQSVRALQQAVSQQISRPAARIVKKNVPFRGHFDSHQFDIGARNGQPIFGANAISFQSPQHETTRKTVDAVAWAIDDVRKEYAELPMAVVAAFPSAETPIFRKARQLYANLAVDLVDESHLAPWAQRMAGQVVEHLPRHLWEGGQAPE